MNSELLQDMFYAAPEFWYGLAGLVLIILVFLLVILIKYLKLRQQNYFLRRDRERYSETLYASRDGYFAFIYPDDKVNDPRENITERCSRRLAVILGLDNGTRSSFADVLKNFYKEDAKKIEKYTYLLRKEGLAFEDYFELKNSKRFVRLEGVRINGADGSVYCDMIWFRDVTATTNRIKNLEDESSKIKTQYNIQCDMLDNLPLAVWLRDDDLKIIYCNKKYADIIDCKSKDDIIANQLELCDTKGENIAKKSASKTRETRKECKTKSGIIIKGNRIAAEIFERPFYLQQNLKETYNTGCLVDISELDEMQRTQKQHQKAQLMILGRLGTAFAVFNKNMVLDFYNEAFLDIWSLNKEQLEKDLTYCDFLDLGRENRRLPEAPDFKAFKKEEQKIFSGLIEPVTDLLHLPDGKTLRRTRAPYLLGGVIFAYEDISDRLAATSAYNQLATVQNEMLNNLSDGVLVLGANGKLMFFNEAYKEIWNAKNEFLLSEPNLSELLDSQKDLLITKENWKTLKKHIGDSILDVTAKTLTLKRNNGDNLQINVAHLSDGSLMIVYKKIDE